VTGANLGRNRGEFQRQLLDQGTAQGRLELGCELVAADQPRSVQADIEIAKNIPWLQAARPFLQPVQMPRRIGAADHGPDRGADHHIGNDAMGNQCADNADMGKSPCGPAPQSEADHRPPDAAEADFVAAVRAVVAANQVIQHRSVSMDGRVEPIR
jgi:hypothetical protein